MVALTVSFEHEGQSYGVRLVGDQETEAELKAIGRQWVAHQLGALTGASEKVEMDGETFVIAKSAEKLPPIRWIRDDGTAVVEV